MTNLNKEVSNRKKKKRNKRESKFYKPHKKNLLSTVQNPPDEGLLSVGNKVFCFTSRPSWLLLYLYR